MAELLTPAEYRLIAQATDNLTANKIQKAITDSTATGTVTSIATTGPISGGPITTTGTITTSMATNKLIGRGTAGTGVMEEITLGTGLSFTGTTLNVTGTAVETLSATLAAGNTTGANNIVVSNGAFIQSPLTGAMQIDFGNNAYLQLSTDAGTMVAPGLFLDPVGLTAQLTSNTASVIVAPANTTVTNATLITLSAPNILYDANITGIKEVNHVISVAATTTAATAGGNLTISAGNGATSGNGGDLILSGGTSPSGSPGNAFLNAGVITVVSSSDTFLNVGRDSITTTIRDIGLSSGRHIDLTVTTNLTINGQVGGSGTIDTAATPNLVFEKGIFISAS